MAKAADNNDDGCADDDDDDDVKILELYYRLISFRKSILNIAMKQENTKSLIANPAH